MNISKLQSEKILDDENNLSYQVATDVFSGPLAKLLELIKKRKRSVHDIRLASLTDEFLTYVKDQTVFPVEVAAEFIGTATQLLVIKTRSLLPDTVTNHDDEAYDLELRLRRYAALERITEQFRNRATNAPLQCRTTNPPKTFFEPQPEIIKSCLEKLKEKIADRQVIVPKAIVSPVVSLQTVMTKILDRLSKNLEFVFDHSVTTSDKVVTLLAILELVKSEAAVVTQHQLFDKIELRPKNLSVPEYKN